MIEEKNLLKISLVCALIGVFILLIISETTKIPELEIKDINKRLLGKEIKIKGKIDSVTNTPGLILLKILDGESSIKTILFKEEVNFTKGQIVEIIGVIKEYKNELEIEAKEINLFENT